MSHPAHRRKTDRTDMNRGLQLYKKKTELGPLLVEENSCRPVTLWQPGMSLRNMFKRAVLRESGIMSKMERIIASEDAFALQHACRYFFNVLNDPRALTAYLRNESGLLHGAFKVHRPNGKTEVDPFRETVRVGEHKLIRMALDNQRIYLIPKGMSKVYSIYAGKDNVDSAVIVESGKKYGHLYPSQLDEMAMPVGDIAFLRLIGKDIVIPQLFSSHDATVIVAASLAALAKLDMSAKRDPLTKLYNRGQFGQLLRYFAESYLNEHIDTAVAITDIDDFKNINDKLGHPIGDKVIVTVATTMATIFRNYDLITTAEGESCRVGGEEFIGLLPEADINGGLAASERFRMALLAKRLPEMKGLKNYEDRDQETIQVSIGVSSFGEAKKAADADKTRPTTIDDIMTAVVWMADQALYSIKESGKNGVGYARIIMKDGKEALDIGRHH